MTEYPQCWDDITWKHKVVYYTFLPLVVAVFVVVLSSPILYFLDVVSYWMTYWMTTGSVFITMLYISYFGEYVIPSQTYRKYRSGEWNNTQYE